MVDIWENVSDLETYFSACVTKRRNLVSKFFSRKYVKTFMEKLFQIFAQEINFREREKKAYK